MVDRGQLFRRAFSWLPAQFASQSDEPVGPRRFGSTEHLSIEAIAAFVDGELQMGAHLRAASHLSQCADCAGEVDAQGQARSALRDSCPIIAPNALLGALTNIPNSASMQLADVPTAGVEDQGFADRPPRDRRRRR
ncbi:RNA polymerase subunit sigma-70 [Mycobacterium sp. CBMA 234]|uniref:anti-sigma E factor RseA n=1 Tax=Mycolicibacterium sp. CBMA 234 TaxID=1918495 RepID=UPI0012DC5972|nr:anti-sigma E factor RseA [Mycolicibacterium sp. CBMA 234]MUL66841.1 RNA polymerase subunit sigma-70 [Mycolicibacterium sp. CBMA 234]